MITGGSGLRIKRSGVRTPRAHNKDFRSEPVQRDEGGKRLNCPRPHGSSTMRDAEIALRAFLLAADTGQVVLPAKTTVADYPAAWLDAVEPSLAATASSNYRIILRCYVLPHLGTHRMTALRPDHLITTYRTLLAGGGRCGRPLSATTVRTVHRILINALGDAVLARNPAANVPLPRAVKPALQVRNRAQS